MIQRSLYQSLNDWRTKVHRKPLIIRGARQVGKTTLVNEFGKEFDNYLYLNLEIIADRNLFIKAPDIATLIQSIFLYQQKSNSKGETLIFIDEIQEAPEAIQFLRYFYEDFPEIYVIAAGSLLEHAWSKVKSFPVGRVEYLTLYPINFIEFLKGIGRDQIALLFDEMPFPDYAHDLTKNIFHTYTMIGGMPEIVNIYGKTNIISDIIPIYESLLQGFTDDIEKYAQNKQQGHILRYIIQQAPKYSGTRITLQNFAGSNYRSREVGEAMRSLQQARIIYLNYPTTSISVPITPDIKKRPKLQFLDTGLMIYGLNLFSEMISIQKLNDITRGKVAEHIISQELQSIHPQPSYQNSFWVKQKQAASEIDLVYPYHDLLIPIEIKSGSTGKLRSLFEYMDRCTHEYAIRMYAGKFHIQSIKTIKGKKFKLMNLPYYLGTKIPEYIKLLIS